MTDYKMEKPLKIESKIIHPISRKFDVKWTYEILNGIELMTHKGKPVKSLALNQMIPYGKGTWRVVELEGKEALALPDGLKGSLSLEFCDVRKCWAITSIHSL